MTIELMARLCHDAVCTLSGHTGRDWDSLDPVHKQFAIDACSMLLKIRRKLEGLDGYAGHFVWIQLKEKQGWTYGPVWDEEQKKDPRLRTPYEDLPREEQIKDDLWVSIVSTLAPYLEE